MDLSASPPLKRVGEGKLIEQDLLLKLMLGIGGQMDPSLEYPRAYWDVVMLLA